MSDDRPDTAERRIAIMQHPKLRLPTKLVAIRILDLQGLKLGASTKSAAGLAADCGLSEGAVRTALKELKREGLLVSEGEPGQRARRSLDLAALARPPRVQSNPGSVEPGFSRTRVQSNPPLGSAEPGTRVQLNPGILEHQIEHQIEHQRADPPASAPPLQLVAPPDRSTASAVAARRSAKTTKVDPDRELMKAARVAAEAAYRRAREPFPGGKLAHNSSEWRQLAQWARSAAEVGLDIGRRYDVEAVLVAAIDASVAVDPRKPVGYWRQRLNETWKQIRNRVPFERVEPRDPRAEDARRAAP